MFHTRCLVVVVCVALVVGSSVTVNFGKQYGYWWTGEYLLRVDIGGYMPVQCTEGDYEKPVTKGNYIFRCCILLDVCGLWTKYKLIQVHTSRRLS